MNWRLGRAYILLVKRYEIWAASHLLYHCVVQNGCHHILFSFTQFYTVGGLFCLLLQVVKVADFGVARVKAQTGVMTAETGTYRWMAPEVWL